MDDGRAVLITVGIIAGGVLIGRAMERFGEGVKKIGEFFDHLSHFAALLIIAFIAMIFVSHRDFSLGESRVGRMLHQVVSAVHTPGR